MRAILIHLVAIFVLFIPILVKAETLSLLSQGNFDQAFRTAYMNVAKDGVGRAEDNLALGTIIFEGLGSAESNVEEGLKYLEIASEQGSLDATIFLAQQHERGERLKKNLPVAIKYYQLANSFDGVDYTEKIATLASDLSAGEITNQVCDTAVAAAQKGKADFYITAAKCLANSDKPLASEFLERKFATSSDEQALEILELLADASEALFNPVEAVRLAKSTDRMSDASQVLTGSTDNILSAIEFAPINCAEALTLQAKGIAEFVCKSVEQSKATSDLLELESVFQANKDLIPQQFVRRARLISAALDGGADAKPNLKIIYDDALASRVSEHKIQMINLYLDHHHLIDDAFSHSAALFVQLAEVPQSDYLELAERLVQTAFDEGRPRNYSHILETFQRGASRNARMATYLKFALVKAIASDDRILLNQAIDVFSNDYRLLVDSDIFVKTALVFLDQISSENKAVDQLAGFVIDHNATILNKVEDNDSDISRLVIDALSSGNCALVEMAVKETNFSIATKFVGYAAEDRHSCIVGRTDQVVKAFEGVLYDATPPDLDALKALCSKDVLNACYGLGLVYKENRLGKYGKNEAAALAITTLERSLKKGSRESALTLAELYGMKNQKEKALAMAEKAYDYGFIDALYISAEIQLRNIFSGKKACKPLMRYISQAPEDSKYYDDAIKLKAKKCKKF